MHVPVNKPVICYVTSKDVIHSFKVIAMRVTQDAIPGMRIPVWFTPTKEGRYQINCAQLCGNSHFAMSSGMLVVGKPAGIRQVARLEGRGYHELRVATRQRQRKRPLPVGTSRSQPFPS